MQSSEANRKQLARDSCDGMRGGQISDEEANNSVAATTGSFTVLERDVEIASTVRIGTARNVAEVSEQRSRSPTPVGVPKANPWNDLTDGAEKRNDSKR